MTACADQSRRTTPAASVGVACGKAVRVIYPASAAKLDAAVRAVSAVRDARAARAGGFDLDAVGVCVDDALHALYQLTGEEAPAAVIDEVFSTFCVGK